MIGYVDVFVFTCVGAVRYWSMVCCAVSVHPRNDIRCRQVHYGGGRGCRAAARQHPHPLGVWSPNLSPAQGSVAHINYNSIALQ